MGNQFAECVWKSQKWASRVGKLGKRNKNYHFSINSDGNTEFYTVFTHFWPILAPLEPKFWGTNFRKWLKVPKTELLWVENGVVGTKIVALAPIVKKIQNFTHFYPFWANFGTPGAKILENQLFGCVWKYQKWTSRGRKWGSGNKNCRFSTNSEENTEFYTFWSILGQFWHPWGPNLGGTNFPKWLKVPKIELLGVENGVIGTKIIALAPIVWKILNFIHFYPFLTNFGTPGAKIWWNQFLEVTGSDKNELDRVENGWLGPQIGIIRWISWKLESKHGFW